MLLPRINAGTVVVQGLSRISGACGLLLLVQILKFVCDFVLGRLMALRSMSHFALVLLRSNATHL